MSSLIPVSDLIGVPFVRGGRDISNGVDCFGLLIECHRRMGLDIPDFRSPEFHHEIASLIDSEKSSWTCHGERGEDALPLSLMQPGRTLLIRIKGCACHVAFVHKPGWLIHAWEDTSGVTQERLSLWKQRIIGVYEFK